MMAVQAPQEYVPYFIILQNTTRLFGSRSFIFLYLVANFIPASRSVRLKL